MDRSPGVAPPISTAYLFPKIERLLLELLRSLDPAQWRLQTISPHWTVRDVAAHLLDTHLRKLSMVRDGFVAKPPRVESEADLIAFINGLNADGVRFYGRLSPAVLISLMEVASRQSADYHASLDPFAPAAFPVSWAGEESSPNWFDTAREFTERWHHQQQIRLAVNRPGILTRELYHPVLDCFLRGLPYAYRNMAAEPGVELRFDIAGECGGTWRIVRAHDCWLLIDQNSSEPAACVTIPQEIAWRIFTKGIDEAEAVAQTRIQGNQDLGRQILRMRAIVG